MAKKQDPSKGAGPYAKATEKFTQVNWNFTGKQPKDRSKAVDANSEASGGFPAGIKPPKE